MELAIHILIQGSWFIATSVPPFVYVLRTGRFVKGVFLAWGLFVLTTFMLSVVLFSLVHHFIAPEIAVKFLPDQIAVPVSIFMGWFWGSIISFIAYSIRRFKIAKRKSLEANANR